MPLDGVPKVEFGLNCPTIHYTANLEAAIRRGLPVLGEYETQEDPVALVLGGPSLAEYFPLLQQKVSGGMKVITVNGAHDYMIEKGIIPSAHIMVDARRFNARFVKNWQKKTKYLISSQCHPQVFKTLKGADVYLFHVMSQPEHGAILADHYGETTVVSGGSTVALRAIPLLSMLGFPNIEVFGFDSCYMDDGHHAYTQTENDGVSSAVINVAGREFRVEAWMYSQAEQFMKMTKVLGDQFNLVVHGDGLIAHLINTGARLLEER